MIFIVLREPKGLIHTILFVAKASLSYELYMKRYKPRSDRQVYRLAGPVENPQLVPSCSVLLIIFVCMCSGQLAGTTTENNHPHLHCLSSLIKNQVCCFL